MLLMALFFVILLIVGGGILAYHLFMWRVVEGKLAALAVTAFVVYLTSYLAEILDVILTQPCV